MMQTSRTSDKKFARIEGGLPFFARVVLSVEVPSAQPGVYFRCAGRGYRAQGCVEEVPEVGYDDWRGGARAGIDYALSIAGAQRVRVEVHQVEGLTTDTNPTIIGYAAMLCVWDALSFAPPDALVTRCEEVVLRSWERPHDAIPDFAR
jgi:hypothetical protein